MPNTKAGTEMNQTGMSVLVEKLRSQEEENQRLREIVQKAIELIRKLYDEDVAHELRKALKP